MTILSWECRKIVNGISYWPFSFATIIYIYIFHIFDNTNLIFTKHIYYEILICNHIKVKKIYIYFVKYFKFGVANDCWRQSNLTLILKGLEVFPKSASVYISFEHGALWNIVTFYVLFFYLGTNALIYIKMFINKLVWKRYLLYPSNNK